MDAANPINVVIPKKVLTVQVWSTSAPIEFVAKWEGPAPSHQVDRSCVPAFATAGAHRCGSASGESCLRQEPMGHRSMRLTGGP